MTTHEDHTASDTLRRVNAARKKLYIAESGREAGGGLDKWMKALGEYLHSLHAAIDAGAFGKPLWQGADPETIEAIRAARKAGKSWTEIAAEHGIRSEP